MSSNSLLFFICPQEMFAEKCEEVNNEQGEYFNNEILAIERTYQGKWCLLNLEENCWSVTGESPVIVYKRQVNRGSINQD